MSTTTCSTCEHWRQPPGVILARAPNTVGTCRLGGPDPDSGCSDAGANETCPKHVEKHHA